MKVKLKEEQVYHLLDLLDRDTRQKVHSKLDTKIIINVIEFNRKLSKKLSEALNER